MNERHLARPVDPAAAGICARRCPSSILLGEYHLGLLVMDVHLQISQHLLTCSHCAGEIDLLKQYLAEVAESP